MNFIYITGFNGGRLLYLKREKHLFTRKDIKNGTSYWICYDTIATAKNLMPGSCRARCKVDEATQVYERNNTPHTCVEDHELYFRDMESLNAMKDHCRYLATNFPYSAYKIPIKDIFLVEMTKLVLLRS